MALLPLWHYYHRRSSRPPATWGFEAGLAHLHRYRVVHGTSNPRQREVIDGFAIGQWAANRRADYRRGRLPAGRVRRLETEFPDWRWTAGDRS
ncbi:helicase associated domain-containing protein [Gordonia terrae]|nr:helicase associated domain-containing protein [Gordonia terrae]